MMILKIGEVATKVQLALMHSGMSAFESLCGQKRIQGEYIVELSKIGSMSSMRTSKENQGDHPHFMLPIMAILSRSRFTVAKE